MARWFPLIRRIVTGGGGGAGFIASVVRPAVDATVQVTARLSSAAAGIMSDTSRQAVRIPTTPAVEVSRLPVVGTTSTSVDPAVDAGVTLDDVLVTADPAGDVVQITYDLTRVAGGDVATNVTGTWTNLTNAQGTPDGATATSAGGLGAGTRKLRLGYADTFGKGPLTITSVVLRFYMAVTGDALGLLSDVTLTYDVGAGEVLLETFAGNAANLAAPRTHDITAAVGGDWSKVDALATFVEHAYAAASAGVSCAVDAVTVTVLANAVQTV